MNGNTSHRSRDMETLRVRPSAGLDDYGQYIVAARQRFANSSGVRTLLSRGEAQFFHSFLLYFCSLGYRMTEPVEGWIRRAADKCSGLGMTTISRVLAAHAQSERGHHLMMVADLRALADLWNRQYQPSADPDALLAQAPSPGVARYCKVHEDNLAGPAPYAQVAIEYEIEMLPLRFGEAFMTRCADVLGPDILSCLSFVTSHIQLDVAHTKTNAWAMAEVFREVPGSTPVLAAAGAAVLDAYAEYLDDCVSLAEQQCRSARYAVTSRVSRPSLDWRLCPPLAKPCGQDGTQLPVWLKEARALRGFVLFDSGRRLVFKTDGGDFSDDDPVDLYSHHVLAYRGAVLVGCLRAYHLGNGPSCLTEAVLGNRSFASILRKLGAERNNVVELGRWICHPSYRAGGRPALQLAAGGAAVALRLANGSAAQHAMVICSVGTLDGQDMMLRRIGLLNAPDTQPVQCEHYGDRLQVMYCDDFQRLNRGFCELMDHMAQVLRLGPLAR
jgi:Acetyltransferase (GNAT) domain